MSHEPNFYFQNVQNLIQIAKMQQKVDKNFLLFHIIAFQLVAINSLYYYENTRSWQSTC